MAQIALPDGNSSTTSWVEGAGDGDGDWFDELDEGVAGNDGITTFWQTGNNPSNLPIAVTLQDVTDPAVHTGHIIKAVWRKSASSGRTISGKIELLEGTTIIATSTDSDVAESTYQTYTYTLTEGEAGNITDYTALIIRVTANDESGSGSNRRLQLTAVEFECPDVAGTVTPISIAGALTPSGAVVMRGNKSFAGADTPTGALTKRGNKTVAGASTPSGAVVKRGNKSFAGADTPTGALTVAKIILLSIAGALTPAGALVKRIAKALAGADTPTGTLAKRGNVNVAGTSTPSGTLSKRGNVNVAGADTPTGALAVTKYITLLITGALTPAGTLIKRVAKTFTGADTPTGALTKRGAKLFSGADTPAGSLAKRGNKTFTGADTPTGALTKRGSVNVAGTSTPSGSLTVELIGTLVDVVGRAWAYLVKRHRVNAFVDMRATATVKFQYMTATAFIDFRNTADAYLIERASAQVYIDDRN